MKMKTIIAISFFVTAAMFVSCDDVKRSPGLVYMPDMGYSRAYETYSDHGILANENINYTTLPVPGTISRGSDMPFPYAKDKVGDSTNYVASKAYKNPLTSMNEVQMKEAERLYLINCAICHGVALDGNGPLYKGGEGPYPAAPKNLVGDPTVVNMPDGQMFYSVTYGKNLMGPYGSQLNRHQRWMIINYIKSKQSGSATPASAPATGGDSAAVAGN